MKRGEIPPLSGVGPIGGIVWVICRLRLKNNVLAFDLSHVLDSDCSWRPHGDVLLV